ncbi:MAG TPA: CxxxxCH/CxxCH domain-containing protein [Anaeromyxobacter sp.]|nr:CxxxxCH/CxxCH domain-containing protein [Anaeromyxobacter sp.]
MTDPQPSASLVASPPSYPSRRRGARLAALTALAAALAACGDADLVRAAGGAPGDGAAAAEAALESTASSAGNHALYAEKGIACADCHACGRRAPDGHGVAWMDRTSPAFHARAANENLASCQLCHGPELDGVGGSTKVSCAACHGATWRSGCTTCHGGADAQTGAPPRATWGNGSDAIRVGAHTAHLGAKHALSAAVPCASCHVVPTDALAPGHADGPTATVTFGGLAVHDLPGPPPAWDRAQATCSVYCHGATLGGGTRKEPAWTATDGLARACDACHGAPPPSPHVGDVDCNACHTGYALGVVVPATHVDGDVDVLPVSCHLCHGSATSDAPPRGTRGETSTTALAVGAHQQHLAGGALSKPMACAECHDVPAPDAMRHADGTAGVAWGVLATTGGTVPAWDRGRATCGSTYCHGAFRGGNAANAPRWTVVDGTQDACGTCHGAPPPAPHVQNGACETCHPGYTRVSVDLAKHVDGLVQYDPLTCSKCHGSASNAAPPVSTTGATSATARGVGAHQAHLAAGTLGPAVACEECHSVPTAMGHADGSVQVVFGPAARNAGATPSFDAASGTCSSVYCHGATLRSDGLNLTPAWTGGAAEVTCRSCHLAPPPAPHPHTAICDNCHAGSTQASVNLATHMNGKVEAENLTCSSCHGDTSRVLVMQADPDAIAAPPYGSRGETDVASRSVGSHQAHVARGDGIALPNKCRYCHVVPQPGAFDHANGVSEVTFGSLATMDGATPSFDGDTCSNTYCHGATLGRGGTSHDPSWVNPAPVGCTTCHGSPPPAPHPQEPDCLRCHPGYTQTTVRKWTHVNGISDFPSGCNSCHDMPPNSGAHYEHLHERVSCDRCHAGYTTTTANETLHRNARQDVTVAGWNASRRTCSANACHGSEYWGRNGTAARESCNQCHGVPPRSGEHYEHSEYACSRCHGTGYSTTTTNATLHMNGASDVPFTFYDRATRTCSSTGCHGSEPWGAPVPVTPSCGNCHGFPPMLPHPQQSACHTCHSSMLSSGVLTEAHNDGTLDIAGAGCATCHGSPPATTRTGGLHPADANCYGCHSTTVGPTNEVTPNGTHNDGYVQVGGGGVGTYGCQTCHGDQKRSVPTDTDRDAKSAPPLGTRGETEASTRAVGAHLAHVARPAASRIARPAACSDCHVVPTEMDHATGTVVMAFGGRAAAGGAAPRWSATALTCASTWCHGATLGAGGTVTEPSWVGGPEQVACGTCHASPPPAPHTASTSCGGCHDGYTATAVNVADHVDGEVDVNASTCDDCHGGAANPAPPAGVHGETLTTDRAVGAHQVHLAPGELANAFACAECHVVPVSMSHVDGAARLDFGPIARAGGPASFDASSLTCSTWCHGATLAAGGTSTAPIWTRVDGSQAGCGACHGLPPPAPHSSNPSCDGCHDGYTSTSVNRAIHVDGRVEVGALTCSSCHGSAVNPAPPIGVDGDTQTTAIAVGAHQQHLQGGFASRPIACSECHVVPAAVGHADAVVQVAFGPLATTGGTPAAWDRATATCSATWCHGAFVGGNLVNAPSWTTVNGTQAACGSCHGAPPPAPHVQRDDCNVCHAGYSPAIVNLATHVDGRVDITPETCTACHGSAANAAPPAGTRGETSESTRAVGAHQRHLAGGPLRGPMACTECHAVPTTIDHVDGSVQLAFGALAATDGAAPTFDPATLSCSNYCHGAVLRGGGTNLAPVWTGGAAETTCGTCHGRPPPPPHPRTQICDNCHPGYTLTSVNLATHVNGLVEADNLTCSSCHGDNSRVLVQQADPLAIAAPPFGSLGQTDPASRSVGQHQAHVSRGDGIAIPNKCRYCHAVPTGFDHADGVSQVAFDSLATVDDATPSFDRTTETCSSTYCHGSTLGRGGTDHTPSWTNPTPVTCTSCHGAPPPPPHPQDADCIRCHPGYTATTVRKATHVNGISDFPSGCNSCHDNPPNSGNHYEHVQRRLACGTCHAGYTSTTENPTLHRNARQDVTLAGWNATQRTCSSNSCHGSRYWGRTGADARQSCNQCHGVPPASGEHFEHSEYACSRCHGTGYTTTTTNATTHMNGVADVPYAFYNRATRTCSSSGCHGSERWGTIAPVTPNCANCHGFPPGLPHPQQSACQSCHPSMLSTGVLTAEHNDGKLDLSGVGCTSCHGSPPTSTRTGVHPADANCYGCHSTTVNAANEVVSNGTHNDGYVQVGGGGTGTYGCQTCHGDQGRTALLGTDPNAKAAPPLGTRGETEATTRAVGAHLAHVNGSALGSPVACAECHVVPTAMDHAMGTVLMAFGPRATAGGAAALWNPETLGCANYCHGGTLAAGGTNHAPSWTGGPGEAACGTCHGAPPPAPHAASASCAVCHAGYTQTSVNPATHVDGIVDAWSHPTGYADGSLHGRDANRQGLAACAGCHGSDLAGGATGVSCNACHAGAGFAAWDTTCTFCHGDRTSGATSPPLAVDGASARASVRVGAHAAHVGADLSSPIACGACHPARAASVVTDAAHLDGDGVAEVTFGALARTGGAAPTYARAGETSATCASTYCHGAFAGGARASPEWTSTAPLGCTSCHGAPPAAPHPANASCGSCHTGYTATSVRPETHVDGILQVTSNHPAGYAAATVHGTQVNTGGFAGCTTCHGADLAGGSGPSCSTCHAAVAADWTTSCTFCHGSRTTGRANPPQDIRNGVATTNVSVGTHESHATSTIAVVACGVCHPARAGSVVADAAHVDGNGRAEIAFSGVARTGNVTPTYTRTSSTSASCANTYCHGNFSGGRRATVSFTSTTEVTCTSCHSSPPSTGKHSTHASRAKCFNCHNAVVNSSNAIVDRTLHQNGAKNVKFGGTYNSRTVTGTWNPTTRSCSSLSCHGSETW